MAIPGPPTFGSGPVISSGLTGVMLPVMVGGGEGLKAVLGAPDRETMFA